MTRTLHALVGLLGWVAVAACNDDAPVGPGLATSSSSSGSGGSSGASGGSSGGGASSGGSTSSGGSSSGDASSCTEVGAGAFQLGRLARGELAEFFGRLEPTLGTETDSLLLTLYGAGANAPGTFDLATGDDANFATCAHCVTVVSGPQDASTLFYQTAGSLTVQATPDAYEGGVRGTLSGLTLVEVTLDPRTLVSTPVPGGRCLTLASISIEVEPPPPPPVVPDTWTCAAAAYADGTCDCACGAPDLDCAADATPASCASCAACGTPAQCTDRVDPADLSACAETQEPETYTCDRFTYDDGAVCDCGCGAFDPDCASAGVAACDSCSACGTARCDLIVSAADNTQCTAAPPVPAGWTCNPVYWADGQCDCACGALDVDCGAAATPAACDYCAACDPAAGVTCSAVVTPDLLACQP